MARGGMLLTLWLAGLEDDSHSGIKHTRNTAQVCQLVSVVTGRFELAYVLRDDPF